MAAPPPAGDGCCRGRWQLLARCVGGAMWSVLGQEATGHRRDHARPPRTPMSTSTRRAPARRRYRPMAGASPTRRSTRTARCCSTCGARRAEGAGRSRTPRRGLPLRSPDSRWIGYFNRVDGTLKKIDTSGGPPITLCRAPNGKGGTWNEDGVIVFAPDASGPLSRVSSAGGEPSELTAIELDRHNSHRHPRFLPGRTPSCLLLARAEYPAEQRCSLIALDTRDRSRSPTSWRR